MASKEWFYTPSSSIATLSFIWSPASAQLVSNSHSILSLHAYTHIHTYTNTLKCTKQFEFILKFTPFIEIHKIP